MTKMTLVLGVVMGIACTSFAALAANNAEPVQPKSGDKNIIQMKSDVKPDDSVMKFRRIITGHDSTGKAIFIADETTPHVRTLFNMSNHTVTEIWKTTAMPVDNAGEANDNISEKVLVPQSGGTILRVVEFPPACEKLSRPIMHRTPTLDYAYVIKGEIYAVVEQGEKLMQAGDVLIQRGTNHSFINRSDKPAVVMFVLIDAKELEGLPLHY